MKKQFCSLVLLFLFSSTLLFSNSGKSAMQDLREMLELFGDLGVKARMSAPILAMKSDDVLTVEFTRLLGVIAISITDEAGLSVYSATCNTNQCSSTSISLSGLESGNYTLSFTDQAGKYLMGEFEIE